MGKFPFKNKVIIATSMNVALVSLSSTLRKDSTKRLQSYFYCWCEQGLASGRGYTSMVLVRYLIK